MQYLYPILRWELFNFTMLKQKLKRPKSLFSKVSSIVKDDCVTVVLPDSLEIPISLVNNSAQQNNVFSYALAAGAAT